MQTMSMRAWDDFHVHFRNAGGLLEQVAPITASYCARALAMPNTEPAITSPEQARQYGEAIVWASGGRLHPLLSAKLMEWMSVPIIQDLHNGGVRFFKLYPLGKGGTTNATHEGVDVSNMQAWERRLRMMEKCGGTLLVHGEVPTAKPERAEQAFLPIMDWLVATFPNLPIVFEHVSSAEGVAWVMAAPANVAATVTPHHFGKVDLDAASPHLCCKPPLKGSEHREAIRQAVFSGNSKFIFGTDSAPHIAEAKSRTPPANGVFNAPVAASFFLREFEKEFGNIDAALPVLERFTSEHGARFHRLSLNTRTVTFSREPWQVPNQYSGVVPMCVGETFDWQVVE